MEKLLESASTPSKGEIPAGAVPTEKSGRLSSHAAEFWFPECRECVCCKGFKHGCDCVKKERFIACQATTCHIDPSHHGQKLTEDTAPRSEATTMRRAVSDSNATICRFDQAPGGCRFGASCRFQHTQGEAGPYKKHSNMQRGVSTGSDYNSNYGEYQTNQGNRSYGNGAFSNNSGRGFYGNGNIHQAQAAPPQSGYGGYYNGGTTYPSQNLQQIQPPSPPNKQAYSVQAPSATSPTGGRDQQICPYFQKGECMFGVNCRNKHM